MLCACLYFVASFESQCVKQGTVVNLHCHNEELWKINGSSIDDTLTFITFNISSETGRRDDMEIVADQDYIEEYEDVSLIRCLKRDYSSLFAILVIAGQWCNSSHYEYLVLFILHTRASTSISGAYTCQLDQPPTGVVVTYLLHCF